MAAQQLCNLWKFIILVAIVDTAASAVATSSCLYPARCIPLGENNLCLGVAVSYTHTSPDLVNSTATLEDVQRNLLTWSALQAVPRCWDAIQPLLCAVFMPKCEETQAQVEMYSRDLCLKTREPCRIVTKYNDGGWPEFLDCDQPHFTPDETCMVCYATIFVCVNDRTIKYLDG